jgi:hypothetical protein
MLPAPSSRFFVAHNEVEHLHCRFQRFPQIQRGSVVRTVGNSNWQTNEANPIQWEGARQVSCACGTQLLRSCATLTGRHRRTTTLENCGTGAHTTGAVAPLSAPLISLHFSRAFTSWIGQATCSVLRAGAARVVRRVTARGGVWWRRRPAGLRRASRAGTETVRSAMRAGCARCAMVAGRCCGDRADDGQSRARRADRQLSASTPASVTGDRASRRSARSRARP